MILASARACAFENECGVIWFSFLYPQECSVEEAESTAELYMTRTVSRIARGEAMLSRVVSNATFVVHCRGVKNVHCSGRDFYMLNVIIRVQAYVYLLPFEKTAILYAISRRLFYVTAAVDRLYSRWMSRRYKRNPGFKFNPSGFLLRDFCSLRLAVSSMSYETSNSKVPSSVPFLHSPILFLKPCRKTYLMSFYIKVVEGGSVLTQPVFLRSMLKSVCPSHLWEIVSRGMCYMPGFREGTYGELEQWQFHVHGSYNDEHANCFPNCNECRYRQPLSLFNSAQLIVLRNMFLTRRARVTHDLSSPFFKGC